MATKTLTRADEYRRSVSKELSEAHEMLGKANSKLDHAKAHLRGAKGEVESAQADVNELVEQLRDIQHGNYQPTLFDKKSQSNGNAKKKPEADTVYEGAARHIESLADYGLTKHETSLLRESEIATIQDLEIVMREDEWWHRKIKGLGQAKIDKVTNALLSFRRKHPVPSPDDIEAKPDKAMNYPDRNAPGGAACGNVNRATWEDGGTFVTAGIGVMGDNTCRSSILFGTENQQPIGRDTPREDSQPHGTQSEAARAAVTELVEARERAGGKRKAMAVDVAAWRDRQWPIEKTEA